MFLFWGGGVNYKSLRRIFNKKVYKYIAYLKKKYIKPKKQVQTNQAGKNVIILSRVTCFDGQKKTY